MMAHVIVGWKMRWILYFRWRFELDELKSLVGLQHLILFKFIYLATLIYSSLLNGKLEKNDN